MSLPLICEFLLNLFKKGSSTSSLNIARSAITFFSLNLLNISENLILKRLFKYFFQNRPLRPRHLVFWPVSQLLNFLSEWHPIHNLSMKQLTLKTVSLIALTSADRGQTIHLMNIDNTVVSDNGISFVIFDKLKNTRRTLKPKVVECVSSDISSLCVSDYVTAYLDKTSMWRDQQAELGKPKPSQLFLSWITKRPVTKQSIRRWLTQTLNLAGIDTSQFSSHSYRGAGLSYAYSKGVPIEKIISHGDWQSVNTFHKYYSAPNQDTPVGQIILNSFRSGECLYENHVYL